MEHERNEQTSDLLTQLGEQWGEMAGTLEPYAPSAAAAYRACARELEEARRLQEAEPLTLQQASALSGYSVDHLGRMVRAGTLRNVGRKHKPLVLRRDLPMRAAGERRVVAPIASPQGSVDIDAMRWARQARAGRTTRAS